MFPPEQAQPRAPEQKMEDRYLQDLGRHKAEMEKLESKEEKREGQQSRMSSQRRDGIICTEIVELRCRATEEMLDSERSYSLRCRRS